MALSGIELATTSRKPGGGTLRGGIPRWIAALRAPRERAERAEKRAFFTNRWLGIALITPQLLLIFTFFYWPAGEALYWAFTLERPWGGGNEWVGFGNFSAILTDPVYWNSIESSIVFALASTGLGMAMAFALAILTDRELKGSRIYRTVLVWPYAIAAPALGMAFRFILAPEAGFLAFVNKIWPGLWNPALHGIDAMIAIVVAFAWKYVGYNFIFFLAALQAILRVIAKKGSPALRRPSPPSRHVFGNAGLADSDAKLKQFTMDARCAPERI